MRRHFLRYSRKRGIKGTLVRMSVHAFNLILTLFFFFFSSSAWAESVSVLVSIPPQKYMVERVAGDLARVAVLVKPGSDPHTFEPGPSQMRAAAKASLWFTIGVPFETIWRDRVIGASGNMTVVSCIRDIKRMGFGDDPHENEHDHHAGEDPHVWLSPLLTARMLPAITEALSKALPEKEPVFVENAMAFERELLVLHKTLFARFAAVSVERRVFLTFHPSWRYYARDFALTELSVEVDGKEPGPKAMRTILDTARKHDIHTLFIEPQFSTAAAKAIAKELGAEVRTADPLAENLIFLYATMADELIASFASKPTTGR